MYFGSQLDRVIAQAAKETIPLEVGLELTHHCNFRCEHCYIPDFSAPDSMSSERIYRLLGELKEMGTLFITLTGGELFLRSDWFEIASRARELGFSLRLFSNASRINRDTAEKIATLHCAVEVSLYSMDRAVFEHITQRPGSFDKTIEGIEHLRALNIPVLLKTPVMTHNFDQVDGVFAYAERIGAEARVDTKIVAKKDGDLVTIGLRKSPAELSSFGYGPSSGCWDPRGDQRATDGPLCAAASRYCNITPQGDVRACNIMPGSGGNLRNSTFREIWEGSPWLNRVRSVRRKDLRECDTCERFNYCGRCQAQALTEDGDLYGPSAWARANADAIDARFGASAREGDA